MTRLSDVTVDTNTKILRKHLSARARRAAPPPRAARRPTPTPRHRPAARPPSTAPVLRRRPHRRRTTPPHQPSRQAKRVRPRRNALRGTRGHDVATPEDVRLRRRALGGPGVAHHHDRGRRRRLLPLELGAASVLSGKGTSLAGVVACVASRPPRRAASGEQRRCRAGVEDGGEEVMGKRISFPDPSRVSVCS